MRTFFVSYEFSDGDTRLDLIRFRIQASSLPEALGLGANMLQKLAGVEVAKLGSLHAYEVK